MKELSINQTLLIHDQTNANNNGKEWIAKQTMIPIINNQNTEKIHISRKSIGSLLQSGVTKFDIEDQDPFYVGDLGEVIRQYKQWTELMPRVTPFYAVKCNPDPMVIKTLAKCGTGFDCASKAEVQLCLDAGVDASRIIYANPCKQASHIQYATARKVNVMTFDNADELYKIKTVAPDSKVVLRILTDDSKSICRFGVKFGASLAIVPQLLKTAIDLELDVIGISFHVGSGCFDATSFTDAVHLARKAFDIGAALGLDFTLLDIGGGFPGNQPDGLQFRDIAALLAPCIDQLFPPSVKVIAEPGRYFVSSAYTLAVNIIARRVVNGASLSEPPSYMYYINDGMYGSFNCITFDHQIVHASPLFRNGLFLYGEQHQTALDEETKYLSSIWGPTCDSIDLIGKDIHLPEMKIGDWLYFPRMGAYTMAAASTFNGFRKSSIVYTNTEV